MTRFVPALTALFIVSPAFARVEGAIYGWRTHLVPAHKLPRLAERIKTAAEAEEFRAMIRRVRPDVDAVIGGLLFRIAPERRARFASIFRPIDPVYGSPAEMARQSCELKKIVNRVAGRLSTAELGLLRMRLAEAPRHLQKPLLEQVIAMGPHVSLASICQRYAVLATCDSALRSGEPPGSPEKSVRAYDFH